jgi:hypothetical protein
VAGRVMLDRVASCTLFNEQITVVRAWLVCMIWVSGLAWCGEQRGWQDGAWQGDALHTN